MRSIASPELARSHMLQRLVQNTRNQLDTASKELTTGLKSDLHKATGGNLNRLFSLERMIARNAVHQDTITTAGLRIDLVQQGLGQMLAQVEDIGVDLAAAHGLGDLSAGMMEAQQARRAFEDAVATLGMRSGGQSLFAGTATGGPALDTAASILADLDAIAAAAPDAATAIADIEAYFAPGGDFLTNRYLGSTEDLPAAEIGDGQRLEYGVRADAEELVGLLRGYALGAVIAGGAFAGSLPEQLLVLGAAADTMLNAKEGLLTLRAEVGLSQYAIETARAGRTAELEAYELAVSKLVASDPYDTASAFERLQAQLDTVFTVTARLSTLRFSNYMR